MKAYYISWCYPGNWEKDQRDYAELELCIGLMNFKSLFKTYDKRYTSCVSLTAERFMVGKMLDHFFKRKPTRKDIEMVVKWPGHSVSRIKIFDLEDLFGMRPQFPGSFVE